MKSMVRVVAVAVAVAVAVCWSLAWAPAAQGYDFRDPHFMFSRRDGARGARAVVTGRAGPPSALRLPAGTQPRPGAAATLLSAAADRVLWRHANLQRARERSGDKH
ncbi:uncharacterized protein LOC134531443 [Bacillus rossius redtenbacheri]|uniref:uncharacterized protein LOC134531443 n=1 Tax=Bacillus rossius redtenbacheri TaxID=93214 RepID=UPI002FDDAA85